MAQKPNIILFFKLTRKSLAGFDEDNSGSEFRERGCAYTLSRGIP